MDVPTIAVAIVLLATAGTVLVSRRELALSRSKKKQKFTENQPATHLAVLQEVKVKLDQYEAMTSDYALHLGQLRDLVAQVHTRIEDIQRQIASPAESLVERRIARVEQGISGNIRRLSVALIEEQNRVNSRLERLESSLEQIYEELHFVTRALALPSAIINQMEVSSIYPRQQPLSLSAQSSMVSPVQLRVAREQGTMSRNEGQVTPTYEVSRPINLFEEPKVMR